MTNTQDKPNGGVTTPVSIVVPVYNEEENILPLAAEMNALVSQLPALEVVFVDDGSTDGTWGKVMESIEQYPCVSGYRCPRNQGQTSAMLHGLRKARGDILVTIDGDLQNDPADIPKAISEMAGADVVCGYRANRKDSWSRRVGSRWANRVRSWVTHDGVIDTGCSLKVFRKECVEDLPFVEGVHRFMPAHFKLHGRSIKQIPVNHRPRVHGVSKYTNLMRLPRTIFDLFGFVWLRRRLLHRMELEKG